ncbi:AAA family ATPase [uncultured Roseibium sp.]|uniref:AAA family ATPase n=1 Tax=uncultured Roseibium sp. TaxID=1936171 RepID=UPI0032167946
MTRRSSEAVCHKQLDAFVPREPDWPVDWSKIWSLWPELAELDACPQDPIHHAEGNAGIHTRMVVEALVTSAEWRRLPSAERSVVFWAAVLHDIGKPATTKSEGDGRITSRGHSRVGAAMARSLLWEAGSPFVWREAVCGIISAHQLPFWLIERPDPERLAIATSWKCRPDHLCLHAMADALGRTCADKASILENINLAKVVFQDAGCPDHPFAFANDESRVTFFEREDRDPNYAAYEDFRCTVTLMAGLPGSGKDTWISANRPEQPVVSLDAVRSILDEPATGNQGRVIQAAYEMARDHLRNSRDFVWNATNVTAQLRSKPLRLFRDYGARIVIVYLEPSRDRLFQQNSQRDAVVPPSAIRDLARKMEPPGKWEAHEMIRIIDGKPLLV